MRTTYSQPSKHAHIWRPANQPTAWAMPSSQPTSQPAANPNQPIGRLLNQPASLSINDETGSEGEGVKEKDEQG
eukprot:5532723-Pyramimonas_sp.AAC.1